MIKKFYFFLFTALIAFNTTSAFADWVRWGMARFPGHGDPGYGDLYADDGITVKQDFYGTERKIIVIPTLKNMDRPELIREEIYNSSTTLIELGCRTKSVRASKITYFSRKNALGDVIASRTYRLEETPWIAPATKSSNLSIVFPEKFGYLCG
jgi:hypothetical protein